jgi:hypothetical protein
MLKKSHLELFTTEQLIAIFIDFYIEEYGAKKARKIVDKVYYSPKILKFIDKLRNENLSPGIDGFITITNTVPYFLFSKGETLCMGSLVAIQKWLNDSVLDILKLNDDQIHNIVTGTIFKAAGTKTNINGEHFFDKYYRKLEELIS